MLSSILRVFKFSLQDIFRNIWLSLVTVIILILALFTVNMLTVVKVIGDTAVEAVKEKVDITVFLKSDAQEDQIMALKADLENFEEVKEVVYISKAQALEDFKREHAKNPQIMDSLRELENNPMDPSLIIKPSDIEHFDSLSARLNLIDSDIISSRDFADYKILINKINTITDKVSEIGIILSSIFIFITVLVIYNSVRVAIYTHKMEIGIMRLVGASNWFIISPYLVSSIIFTLAGVLIIVATFLPFLGILEPYLMTFINDYPINLLQYYYSNFFMLFGVQFLVAAGINVIASYIAVRKYSKV